MSPLPVKFGSPKLRASAATVAPTSPVGKRGRTPVPAATPVKENRATANRTVTTPGRRPPATPIPSAIPLRLYSDLAADRGLAMACDQARPLPSPSQPYHRRSRVLPALDDVDILCMPSPDAPAPKPRVWNISSPVRRARVPFAMARPPGGVGSEASPVQTPRKSEGPRRVAAMDSPSGGALRPTAGPDVFMAELDGAADDGGVAW